MKILEGTGYMKILEGDTGYMKILEGTGYMKILENTGYMKILEDTGYMKILEGGTGYMKILEGTGYMKILEDTGYMKILEDTGYTVSPFPPKETTFLTSCWLYRTPKKLFPYMVDPFSEGYKNDFHRTVSLESSVSILIKVTKARLPRDNSGLKVFVFAFLRKEGCSS